MNIKNEDIQVQNKIIHEEEKRRLEVVSYQSNGEELTVKMQTNKNLEFLFSFVFFLCWESEVRDTVWKKKEPPYILHLDKNPPSEWMVSEWKRFALPIHHLS